MRIVLAAERTENGADAENLARLADRVAQHPDADLVLFPEGFAQGLDGATFEAEHDLPVGWRQDGPELDALRALARVHGVAIGLGYLERVAGDCPGDQPPHRWDGTVVPALAPEHLHDSYLVVDADGATLLHYRRRSHTWRTHFADPDVYRDGRDYAVVELAGRRVGLGLCGDLWLDAAPLVEATCDLVLWPLWVGYSPRQWHVAEAPDLPPVLDTYADLAARLGCPAVIVNAVCWGEPGGAAAYGGAFVFSDGAVLAQLPMTGEPGALVWDWTPAPASPATGA